MNISYRWLREIVPDLNADVDGLAMRLAQLGAPVEEVVPIGEALSGIRIARVAEVRAHPNADRLSLCTVEAGDGEPLQVVCGAPNVRAGAFYPFAPVGATLPGGMKIRKAKIRGESSHGMLCSARELELGRDQEGILQLHGTFSPGEDLATAVGLDDVRLVLEVTANRPDLLSHYGVAREVAPGGERSLRLAAPAANGNGQGISAVEDDVEVRSAEGVEGHAGGVRVRVEDAGACPRYMGAVVRGVRVGPSPAWMATRLRALGLRPVNNVVDATNYVLHELGQPLHAFDLDRLAGGEVVIRPGRPGERIRTLDGEDRALDDSMLVIADGDAPVAIAGVMGGEESEVGEETGDVFLECALFDPRSVRSTRRALGMSTDASYRFERGVDSEGMERALRRAVALIRAVAGGSVDGHAIDIYPTQPPPPEVAVRPARAAKVLGVPVTGDDVAEILEPLGFEIVDRAPEEVRVRVPGHRRGDVSREADLIEEVARRRGYDSFPEVLLPFRPTRVPDDPVYRTEDRLRAFLVARGLLEARSMPLVREEGEVVLDNPLSTQESVLRQAIVPGLVRRVEHNFARGLRDVRLFEIGTVFFGERIEDGRPTEARRVAVVLTGRRNPPHWSGEPEPYDLWDAKAVLGALCRFVGIDAPQIEPGAPDDSPWLDPETVQALDAEGSPMGTAGRITDDSVDAPAWSDPVWAVEVEVRVPPARDLRVAIPPSQPPAERDLALVVPEAVSAAVVERTIRTASGELLESIRLFDLYRGDELPKATRSLAWRLLFRAPDRTLTDLEVDEAVGRVLRELDALGVQRR